MSVGAGCGNSPGLQFRCARDGWQSLHAKLEKSTTGSVQPFKHRRGFLGVCRNLVDRTVDRLLRWRWGDALQSGIGIHDRVGLWGCDHHKFVGLLPALLHGRIDMTADIEDDQIGMPAHGSALVQQSIQCGAGNSGFCRRPKGKHPQGNQVPPGQRHHHCHP